ncbi:MAG: NADH-quinone oxidoreductase subunit C [Bacteroidetes bacterium]|nr:NADH-quinone oxidoreductase subunit C [Bacteroidota bacterium]
MNTKDMFDHLAALFPDLELQLDEDVPCIIVPPDAIREVGLQLRDDEQLLLDSLMCLSGVDFADGTLGVVYHLHSMLHNHKLTVKVVVPVENPHVQTVERVWRTADWHEREAYDLIGVIFDGHRDLRRILNPYDWEGHPLRKDYEVPEFYNGMKVPY